MPNRADCERSSVDFSPRQRGGRSFIPQTIFGQRGCLSSSSSLAVRGRQKHGRRCLGVLTTTPAVTPRLVDVYYTLIPDCIRAYQIPYRRRCLPDSWEGSEAPSFVPLLAHEVLCIWLSCITGFNDTPCNRHTHVAGPFQPVLV